MRRGLILAVPAVALAVALRLAFLQTGLRHLPVSADESITVLQAKKIATGDLQLLFLGQPYAFPLGSYLMAPVVKLLPRTPLGARWLDALLGLAGLYLGLLMLRRTYPTGPGWPGALLVLFPSVYLVMLQFGYALPLYGTSFMLWYVTAFLALKGREADRRRALWLLSAGLAAGLAVSHHLLSLAVAVPVLFYLAFDGTRGRSARNLASFLPGMFVGLLPFLAARLLFGSAHEAVSRAVSGSEATGRIWSPTLTRILPSALGGDSVLFPDYPRTYPANRELALFVSVCFIFLLAAATVFSLRRFLREVVENRRAYLGPQDLFLGAGWLCLVFYVFSQRARHASPRYLLPAVWALPFLLGYLASLPGRRPRAAARLAAVVMAVINIGLTLGMLNQWRKPGFALREANMPDLAPAIEFLDSRGSRFCYATYAVSYRLTFATDERIICAQPFNERFPGWPTPYKDLVDRQKDTPYVLTDKVKRFRSIDFEKDLRAANADFTKTRAGDFVIYHDFKDPWSRMEVQVDRASVRLEADANPADAGRMNDGDPLTFWTSGRPQAPGEGIGLMLTEPLPLNRISLAMGPGEHDRPYSVSILARSDSGWRPVRERASLKLEPFGWRNGHPVYGSRPFNLRFPPTDAAALRLEISKANEKRPWSLAEVELYRLPLPPPRD